MTQAPSRLLPNKNILELYKPTRDVLGKGGFGMVVKAHNRLTGSPVAVKIQSKSSIAEAEASMLSTLKAAHLVQCRGVFEEHVDFVSPRVFIVMDLVPEKSITEAFLQPDIRLSLNEITCVAHQALEFLADTYRQKTVIFDMKPENLIYKRASRSLTVIDLGAARQIGTDSSAPITITPGYQAPEYILDGDIDQSYDCWTLACTIFKIVTRSKLFSIPKELPKQHWNNFVLHLIIQQIGEPTPEYLNICRKAIDYFDDKMELKHVLPVPKLKNWKGRIRDAAREKKWPLSEVDQLTDLMSRMLCYENRATPDELLKHPLFNSQTVLHLLHDPQKTGKLYVQRASTIAVSLEALTPDHIASPDFVLDFQQPFTRCLHLPRDPKGKYIVILEKDGAYRKTNYFFRKLKKLDIRALQKTIADENVLVSIPHINARQVQIAERVPAAKRRLSFSRNAGKKLEGPSFKKPRIE